MKRVLVIGMPRSGIAAARLLHEKGDVVVLSDRKNEAEFGNALDELRQENVEFRLGEDAQSLLPGVDLVAPDITYLEKNADRIRGFVITHGHEDHIGALPYVLKRIDAPIYCTSLTRALIEYKFKEHKINGAVINTIHPKDKVRIGKFEVEFITHIFFTL